jgi:hypothetical protein
MRAQVVGRRLEWWCEADGAALFVDADEPVLSSATVRFVEQHSTHDGALSEGAPRSQPMTVGQTAC